MKRRKGMWGIRGKGRVVKKKGREGRAGGNHAYFDQGHHMGHLQDLLLQQNEKLTASPLPAPLAAFEEIPLSCMGGESP